MSGELQKAVEEKIGGFVPMRATAVLSTAALQRKAIAASNMLFGWDSYPTFYGSQDIYVPGYQAIRMNPRGGSEGSLDGIREFGSRLSNFAQNNPEVNICLALPENGIHSSVVPPWSYVSRTWSLEETLAVWREQLDGVDTVFVATSPVASFEEYLERYYRCDDHWNGFGALLTS